MSLSDMLDASRRRRGLASMLQQSRRKRQTASSSSMRVLLAAMPNPDYRSGRLAEVQIKPRWVQVPTLREASQVVRRFIQSQDLGGGNWIGGEVQRDGKAIAWVSYNGRVWLSSTARQQVTGQALDDPAYALGARQVSIPKQQRKQQQRPSRAKSAGKWESPEFGAVSVDLATDTRGREWLNLRSNLPGERGLRFGWSSSEGRWGLGRVPPIGLVREAHAHGWDQFPIPSPEEVDIAGLPKKGRKQKKGTKAPPQARAVQNNAGFKVGDILVASWGYDQTNVDFYEVVGLTKGTIDLCSIGKRTDSRATGANYVVPVPGTCTGKAVRKRTRGGSDGVVAPRYGTAFRWKGRPMYQTAGGFGH